MREEEGNMISSLKTFYYNSPVYLILMIFQHLKTVNGTEQHQVCIRR
nr:MAG TPA: hypothetical protein [Bacteriophage sp.]